MNFDKFLKEYKVNFKTQLTEKEKELIEKYAQVYLSIYYGV